MPRCGVSRDLYPQECRVKFVVRYRLRDLKDRDKLDSYEVGPFVTREAAETALQGLCRADWKGCHFAGGKVEPTSTEAS